jgi:alpha-tubulin suppressor-like RCC1 family protein
MTDNVGLVEAAIKRWSAEGGGDLPEGQLYALDQLTESGIGWRPNSQRILVWFGDAPGHDPICEALSGLTYAVTEKSVTAKLQRERIRVVALSVATTGAAPGGLDGNPKAGATEYAKCGDPGGDSRQATRIAEATGGKHVSGVQPAAAVETILAEVQKQLVWPIYTWGYGGWGELGRTPKSEMDAHPVVVPLPPDCPTGRVTAIATGQYTCLVLLDGGEVWNWGSTFYGQLGAGPLATGLAYSSEPVRVKATGTDGAPIKATAIAGGGWHSLAMKDDGTVWAWGYNFQGQLGDHSNANSNVPVQVVDNDRHPIKAKAIAGGSYHSLAATPGDGTVWAWGRNDYGQLGNGSTTPSNVALQVLKDGKALKAEAIAGGGWHSLALLEDGTVMAWGSNYYGQLGNGSTTDSHVPVKVQGIPAVREDGTLVKGTAIAADGHNSLALLDDGTVWAWGWNNYGQLGDGSTTDSHVPVKVQGIPVKATAIALAAPFVEEEGAHCLALLEDGTVMAWGSNYWGQMGDDKKGKDPRLLPAPVDTLRNVKAIDASGLHNLAWS